MIFMKCDKCGREYFGDRNYCSFCGANLKKEKRCPHCGEVNENDAYFCISCGHGLNEVKSKKFNPVVVWLTFIALFAVYVCISLFV